jgi:hypothetical protein
MTPYQLLLLCVLMAWPIAIGCLLVLMGRLEDYVARVNGDSPDQTASVGAPEREVKIVFGDTVIGEANGDHSRATHSTSTRAPFGNSATPTVARAGGSDPKNSS